MSIRAHIAGVLIQITIKTVPEISIFCNFLFLIVEKLFEHFAANTVCFIQVQQCKIEHFVTAEIYCFV
jgi:hypothetical protein